MTAREEKRDQKREQILRGAIEAFAAGGFHRTRVSDVARAAGVADGTIYLYFANKNELLEAIFENAMESFHRALEADVLAVEDPVEQLRRLIYAQLRGIGEDRQLAAVFQIDLRHSAHFLGELSRTALRPHFEFITGIVERGQRGGCFRPEIEAKQAAAMIFGVLDQLATQWVLSRRNYRLESHADAAASLLLHGLGVTTK